MKDAIGIGLIGYGMAARVFHAPLFEAAPRLRLRKVVERRGEEARRRHPQVEVVSDAAELLGDDEIESVVVATPNDSHFELARAALAAGKQTVVEKPFTNSSAQARAGARSWPSSPKRRETRFVSSSWRARAASGDAPCRSPSEIDEERAERGL